MQSQVVPTNADEERLNTEESNFNSAKKQSVILTRKRATVQLPEEMSEEVNSFIKLTILMIAIQIGGLNLGYSLSYMTLSYDKVFSLITLQGSETEEQGLFGAILPIGSFVGAILTYWLLKFLTRNQSLIVADICGILSLLAIIANREVILAFRFMFGVSNGIQCIVMPIYVKDLCPQKYYVKFSVLAGFMIGNGLLLGNLMGLGYLNEDIEDWWRVVFAIPALICFLRQIVITFIFKMESPISLLEREQNAKAKIILSQIYEEFCVEQAYQKCLLRVAYNQTHNEGIASIFDKKHRITILIGLVLMFCYTWCGIQAVFSFSAQLLEILVGDDLVYITILSIILGISSQLPLFISGKLYGNYGKRTLLLVGNGLIILCQLIILSLSYVDEYSASIASFIFICLFSFIFSATLGPITWQMTPEINNSDGTYFCIVSIWGWQLILLYVYPFMQSSLGVGGSFVFFTALTVLSNIFFYFTVKNTFNMNHNEIDALYGKE